MGLFSILPILAVGYAFLGPAQPGEASILCAAGWIGLAPVAGAALLLIASLRMMRDLRRR